MFLKRAYILALEGQGFTRGLIKTNEAIITQQPSATAVIDSIESNKGRPDQPMRKAGFFESRDYKKYFRQNNFEETRKEINRLLFSIEPQEAPTPC